MCLPLNHGCIFLGPGSRTHPHELPKLPGVTALTLKDGALLLNAGTVHVRNADGSKSTVLAADAKEFLLCNSDGDEVSGLEIRTGDRFRTSEYCVVNYCRFVAVQHGAAVLDVHTDRVPDAYLIPLIIPPGRVHIFDVVSVHPYDETATPATQARGIQE